MKRLNVITYPDMGWVCVLGVVEEITPELQKLCDDNDWVIHEVQLDTAEAFQARIA